MSEEITFHINEQDPSLIIEGKFTNSIWRELILILVEDINHPTLEEIRLVTKVNEEINDVLEMIILEELNKFFAEQSLNEESLSSFIKKLNGAGKNQIRLIDEAIRGYPSLFWNLIEIELVEKCLKPLLTNLKIDRKKNKYSVQKQS